MESKDKLVNLEEICSPGKLLKQDRAGCPARSPFPHSPPSRCILRAPRARPGPEQQRLGSSRAGSPSGCSLLGAPRASLSAPPPSCVPRVAAATPRRCHWLSAGHVGAQRPLGDYKSRHAPLRPPHLTSPARQPHYGHF